MKLVSSISIIILCLSSLSLQGQNEADLDLARTILKEDPEPDYSYTYEGKTEIFETLKLLFTGYKYLVSSQDIQACNFHPSCSVYAMETIRSNGILSGGLDTFDRISRCHPLALDQYEIHSESGLASDPVSSPADEN